MNRLVFIAACAAFWCGGRLIDRTLAPVPVYERAPNSLMDQVWPWYTNVGDEPTQLTVMSGNRAEIE